MVFSDTFLILTKRKNILGWEMVLVNCQRSPCRLVFDVTNFSYLDLVPRSNWFSLTENGNSCRRAVFV